MIAASDNTFAALWSALVLIAPAILKAALLLIVCLIVSRILLAASG